MGATEAAVDMERQKLKIDEELRRLEADLRGVGMKESEIKHAIEEERKGMMEALKSGSLVFDDADLEHDREGEAADSKRQKSNKDRDGTKGKEGERRRHA